MSANLLLTAPMVQTLSQARIGRRAAAVGAAFLAAALAGAGSVHAETNNRQTEQAALRRATAEARTRAVKGDFEGAEQALAALNPAPRNTALWYFDVAQRMTLLAGNLARAGQPDAARRAAARAVASLQRADALAAEPPLRAGIQQQIGFLQERYLGDPASAKTAYRAAAQLDSGSASARERVKRVEQAEASAALKK